jgi:AraC-like DNA-binding protein/mannose-6-phosphate isomerase-like protein (cupin superfamily)
MQNYDIPTDETGKELNPHGDYWFPLAGYDELFSQFALKEVPWHWHDEVELVVVLEGATKVQCLGDSTIVNPGEGIFINGNILHRLTQVGKTDCHIINFVFKPEFIENRLDSKIYRDFIQPISTNTSLTFMKFTPEIPWHNVLLNQFSNAFQLYTKGNYGYELMVKSSLTQLWYTMVTNVLKDLDSIKPLTDQEKRLSTMIKYIHENYSQKLSVAQLAKTTDISESECYRVFKQLLNTTPVEYITNHRLQLAASELVRTNISLTTLSLNLGFNSSSYFSKKFKEKYRMTPKEYRSQ